MACKVTQVQFCNTMARRTSITETTASRSSMYPVSDRSSYWAPRRMIARLRAKSASEFPFLCNKAVSLPTAVLMSALQAAANHQFKWVIWCHVPKPGLAPFSEYRQAVPWHTLEFLLTEEPLLRFTKAPCMTAQRCHHLGNASYAGRYATGCGFADQHVGGDSGDCPGRRYAGCMKVSMAAILLL